MYTRSLFVSLLGVLSLACVSGCGSAPKEMSGSEKSELDAQVRSTVADFRAADPGMDKFFSGAYAYAVFPDVTAGAMVVGAAHGEGEVLRNGRIIGFADVSKANVGAQVGGQSFQQILFFENEGSYTQFRDGSFELDAKASAVASSNWNF